MTLSTILLTALLMQVPAEGPPAPEQVRALLMSADAKDQAWGAWWTSESKLSNMEPLLQKNLEAHVHGSDLQDVLVVDSTLDAYIQSNSTPPPVELLATVYERRPAPALVLLSRIKAKEQADPFLLRLVPYEANWGRGYEWFAASNILLSHRAPGFVAAVLRDLRIQTTVTVCETGSPCRRGGGSGNILDGLIGPRPTPGFPPSATYSLVPRGSSYAESISTILMDGPVPMGYARRISPANVSIETNGRAPGGIDPPRPFTSDRLKYVAAALDSKSASLTRLPIQNDESQVIQWKDEPTFVADIQRIRQDIQKRYSEMIQQLLLNQLMNAEEARELATARVDITFDDRRTVDRTNLRNLADR